VRWHIVPDLDGAALCRRVLPPIAAKRSIADMTHDGIKPGQLCDPCLTVFGRGVRIVDDSEDIESE
jgi:hypothetical protein